METNIKLIWSPISKLIQLVDFLGALLSKLAGLTISIRAILAKNTLLPLLPLLSLFLTAAASATDAEIQKKIHGSDRDVTFMISNGEMKHIIEIRKRREWMG